MKKLLIPAIAALGLIGTSAFAADLARKRPVKAPPPAPAPVFSWTGWRGHQFFGVEVVHRAKLGGGVIPGII